MKGSPEMVKESERINDIYKDCLRLNFIHAYDGVRLFKQCYNVPGLPKSAYTGVKSA